MNFKNLFRNKIDDFLDQDPLITRDSHNRYKGMLIILPLCIAFFLLLGFISYGKDIWFWMRNELSPNEILVYTKGLNPKDKLIIKYTLENYGDTLVIYQQHHVIDDKFKNSGNNTFLVYVNDSLVGRRTQFKPIYWKGFRYIFFIQRKGNFFDMNISME